MAATYAKKGGRWAGQRPVAELSAERWSPSRSPTLVAEPLGRALAAEPLGLRWSPSRSAGWSPSRSAGADDRGNAGSKGLHARRGAPDDSLATSGAVPTGAPTQPANTLMAAPARGAIADPCLLMPLPPSREPRRRPKAWLDAGREGSATRPARHADRRSAVVNRWAESAVPRQGSRPVKENCPGTMRGPCPTAVGASSIIHAFVNFVVQRVNLAISGVPGAAGAVARSVTPGHTP